MVGSMKTISLKLIVTKSGVRVDANTLTGAPLKFVASFDGNYAVVWRTYSPGNPHLDDGKLWLLHKEQGNEFKVVYERSVFYASKVAVSNNGLVAWVRSEGHKSTTPQLEIIDDNGDYILEDVTLTHVAECITFSATGNIVALLLSKSPASKARAFAWDVRTGKNVAAFRLLLTGGNSNLNVTEDSYSITTYDGTEVVHAFDGTIISDNRFDKIIGYEYLWGLRSGLDKWPIEQLNYALNSLNTLIRTVMFPLAKKHDRDNVKLIRNKILKTLGEAAVEDTSATIHIQGELYGKLSDCVASGLFGNDAETVALNLLSRALDFVQPKTYG